jgi:hypothetical protein
VPEIEPRLLCLSDDGVPNILSLNVGFDSVEWIQLAHDTVQWQDLVNILLAFVVGISLPAEQLPALQEGKRDRTCSRVDCTTILHSEGFWFKSPHCERLFWQVAWFSSAPAGHWRNSTSLGHDRLLLVVFQFIIHQISCQSGL